MMKEEKRRITIEKEDEDFVLDITTNGFQWSMVYRGTMAECNILAEAFKKIGFVFDEKTMQR